MKYIIYLHTTTILLNNNSKHSIYQKKLNNINIILSVQ